MDVNLENGHKKIRRKQNEKPAPKPQQQAQQPKPAAVQPAPPQPVQQVQKPQRDVGIGIDIGTGNLISSISIDGQASFKLQRDAFLGIENNIMAKNMMKKMEANYIVSEDKKQLYVVGDEALHLANFFNKECRRPLAHGCISTREAEALSMIKVMLHGLLGDPIIENEPCYFSIPAAPLDEENQNVVYHENLLKSFITSFGFNAMPINEAFAITWSELEEETYTGLSISWGAGMVNCALSYMGMSEPQHQFSLARSGDWIDEHSAQAVGLKASRMTVVKEQGVDLMNPQGREQTAIKIYYENLIKYVCKALEKKLNVGDVPNFQEPITVVVSGGTSKAINFEKVFEAELRKMTFPFQIKTVKKASDQLNAVAKGCLLNAALNYEE